MRFDVPISAGALTAVLSLGCASARGVSISSGTVGDGPRTQTERSRYAETSTHAQVLAFIDSLDDSRARFGTDYYALRGRISILSEAYSHDPFEVRVRATYVFVRELLSLVAERQTRVLSIASTSDAALSAPTPPTWTVPVRAELTKSPRSAEVTFEELDRTTDTTRVEPGVRRGIRRTGRMRTQVLPVHDPFDPTLSRPVPWGYAVAPADTGAMPVLQLHGIRMDTLTSPWSGDTGPQFVVDSASVAARPFQGRREVRLTGRWVNGRPITLEKGTIIARTSQPLGILLVYLLEPESDDGVVAWDIATHAPGGTAPQPVTRSSRALSR